MTTPISAIDEYLAKEAERINKIIIRSMCYLGEKCIIKVRDRPQESSWFDHTGNLRSSIGYIVVADGKIVQISGFNQIKQGTEGPKEGKNLALKLAKLFKTNYALIVVAGMNYAFKVESLSNKDVLASAELYAKRELPKMVENIKMNISA